MACGVGVFIAVFIISGRLTEHQTALWIRSFARFALVLLVLVMFIVLLVLLEQWMLVNFVR